MTLYATCDRCEAIQEVATPAEQVTWTCPACSVPRPRKKRASRAKPKRIKQCQHCGWDFTQYHNRQRFCRPACRISSVPEGQAMPTKHRKFTTEERQRGALKAAKNKREKMPPELTPEELAIYRRGYTRGYVLGYNALRRERAGKKEAA